MVDCDDVAESNAGTVPKQAAKASADVASDTRKDWQAATSATSLRIILVTIVSNSACQPRRDWRDGLASCLNVVLLQCNNGSSCSSKIETRCQMCDLHVARCIKSSSLAATQSHRRRVFSFGKETKFACTVGDNHRIMFAFRQLAFPTPRSDTATHMAMSDAWPPDLKKANSHRHGRSLSGTNPFEGCSTRPSPIMSHAAFAISDGWMACYLRPANALCRVSDV